MRERPSGEAQKTVPRSAATLCPLNVSQKNPCAGARARDTDAARWVAIKKRLAEELGRDVFESWFAKLALVQIREGVTLLKPPSKFIAHWLTDNHAERVLRAWQAERPDITTVRFDHHAAAELDEPAAAEQPAVRR